MKMKRKVLSFCLVVLVAAVCLSAVFTNANAESVYYEGGLQYTVRNGQATIVRMIESPGAKLVIPEKLGNYPVTKIAGGAFTGFVRDTEVVIGDSVVTIEPYAFYGCEKMVSLWQFYHWKDNIASISEKKQMGEEVQIEDAANPAASPPRSPPISFQVLQDVI